MFMRDDRRNSGRIADSTNMSECALQFSPSMIAKRQADLLLERVAHSNRKIAFIENKKPDLGYVAILNRSIAPVISGTAHRRTESQRSRR